MADADLVEAREAYEFWSRRAARLPWHRRAARREAREMAARWRVRLVHAQLERWRLGWLERLLLPLLDTRGRSGGAHVGRLAWGGMRRSPVGRALVIAASAVTLAAGATFVLLVVLIAHLL